ncbi:guanitoxin biosynthesis heme-dependent pre-guanitoxin N-hydroxylase GntA [Pedobacter sp. SAFR-022]|uniref:guanitoxin biosynthesis heme-dependent pre-guanitoxin N-hydroxylase GntA n=1 Tax=Pedobacter sp. SAFR-022 TaxID=3436861 RepID=UPI003F8053FA
MDIQIKQSETYFLPDQISEDVHSRAWKVNQEFIRKVDTTEYPCVGAKAAFNTKQYRLGIYGNMAAEDSTQALANDLKLYIEDSLGKDCNYMSMIAVFEDRVDSELEFEKKLWQQLQKLHDADTDADWDPSVSSDPADKNFSFSFNGYAFFVVGLHPQASRRARRFGFTAMAFNLHKQFEALRESGVYEKMKNTIRSREKNYDGGINPMLKDHGQGLEAPQYSGREVDESWKCPFLSRSMDLSDLDLSSNSHK